MGDVTVDCYLFHTQMWKGEGSWETKFNDTSLSLEQRNSMQPHPPFWVGWGPIWSKKYFFIRTLLLPVCLLEVESRDLLDREVTASGNTLIGFTVQFPLWRWCHLSEHLFNRSELKVVLAIAVILLKNTILMLIIHWKKAPPLLLKSKTKSK